MTAHGQPTHARSAPSGMPSGRRLQRIAALPAILALAGTLFAWGSATAEPVDKPFISGRVLVQPNAGLSATQFEEILKQHGGRSLGRLRNLPVHVVEVPVNAEDAVARALSRNPNVKFAEKDLLLSPDSTPNDPQFGSEWHLAKVQAPTAWDSSLGNGVIVAVLDSGVDPTHPDLVNKLVPGWNLYDNNADTRDVYGHGTKVAGVIGAETNNAVGVASVAAGASIMPVRVAAVTGSAASSTLASGLTWAADHGAKVANMSFAVAYSATVTSGVQYFRNKGGVAVCAAGNTGAFDATAENAYMITAGATTSTDGIASFSTSGAFVDVSAPGSSILTTTNGGGYASVSGTSFSSPCTAGVVALMMAANPALPPAQLEALLMDTADDLGAPGWDASFGRGRVNAARAVAAAAAAKALDSQAPSVSIASPVGGTVTGVVPVSATATDNVGVSRVDLYANGTMVGSDTVDPFQMSLDTTKLPEGKSTLVAYAYDAAGNKGISQTVTLTVDNVPDPPDTTAPAVRILSPANGAKVSGNVTISISASDNVGLSLVQGYVDGSVQCVSNLTTLKCTWNARKAAPGSHTITARAQDAAGNLGTATIQVTR